MVFLWKIRSQIGVNKFLWEKLWNLRSSDDRAFDRKSKGPGLVTQRSGSVPFCTEKFLKIFLFYMFFTFWRIYSLFWIVLIIIIVLSEGFPIVYYVSRRTMRVIARRATMLAGDRSQGVLEASVRRSRGVADA